jgi:hypothetical protein
MPKRGCTAESSVLCSAMNIGIMYSVVFDPCSESRLGLWGQYPVFDLAHDLDGLFSERKGEDLVVVSSRFL